ncbi:hypothetical protein BURPS1106B_2229 [Burkholderia pseudomallei 1106b]|nr:hypothetical protein BURPS1106B_2229 [Burkholderia pseudomallei 1106b]
MTQWPEPGTRSTSGIPRSGPSRRRRWRPAAREDVPFA